MPLPKTLEAALQQRGDRVRVLHAGDVALGFGRVWLPHALERKYPNAATELGSQYLFPAKCPTRDPLRSRFSMYAYSLASTAAH